MDTSQYVDDEIREEWEGNDPRFCIEPLQPRIDTTIHDEEVAA